MNKEIRDRMFRLPNDLKKILHHWLLEKTFCQESRSLEQMGDDIYGILILWSSKN